MRRFRQLLIAIIASVVAFALLAELLTSFTKEGNAVDFVRDPDLVLVRRPSTAGWTWMVGTDRWVEVRINEHHMREDPLPAERAPEEVRVLCLGDSFTFGGGLEQREAWPAQMQGVLGPPAESGVRVLNGGANGWFTRFQRIFLEKKFDAIDPDVVVLGWNWNDLVPGQQFGAEVVEHHILGDGCVVCRVGYGQDWLRGTHLYRFVHQKRHGAERVPTAAQLAAALAEYRSNIVNRAINPEVVAVRLRAERGMEGEPDWEFWRETESAAFLAARVEMEAMAGFLRERGRALVVAFMPEPTWIGPGPFPAARRLGVALDRAGVAWVDLGPEFLATHRDPSRRHRPELWQPYDPVHPSAAGQRIIAERTLERLRELGLLD